MWIVHYFRVVGGTTLKFVYDIGSSSFAAFAQSSYSLFSSHTYYFVRRRRPHVLFFRQHNNNNRDWHIKTLTKTSPKQGAPINVWESEALRVKWKEQCDKMSILFFQYLPICHSENAPNTI